MRLAVYTDYSYRREEGSVYGERAFVLFLAGLAGLVEHMVLLGRLDPAPGRSHYPVPPAIEFVPLPHYRSAADPFGVARAAAGSLRRFWRALDGVDGVWLLGPNPLALAFAALARLRRRRVVLGVRQDLREYARRRHPRRPWVGAAAALLDGAYRLLARRHAVVVVGPGLADRFRAAPRLLELYVSLVRAADVVDEPGPRAYDGELRALSVGRLEAEKNPLLLADVLALLRREDPRWRLVVCGEGPLAGELGRRLERLGVREHADLRGYLPFDRELRALYRDSQAFLHVSWTEGMPQVLFEAFAAGLPTVATAVGGVSEAAGDAALLVPPGDAAAAADALRRLGDDADLRAALVAAGRDRARRHTLESESARLRAFLEAALGL
jgi:glycosyltransferase involved in cell wall biosynthesis